MGAFDATRPPEPEVIADCVHCGFCLEACPTYQLWGEEPDSPRGRIVLISEGLDPQATLTPAMITHFDRCLGCLGCVTACPSGVRYDRLIERVRPQIERQHRRPLGERAVRALLYATLPHPRRLRALAPLIGLGGRIPSRALPAALAPLLEVAPRRPDGAATVDRIAEWTPAVGERRGRVGLLLGCVQRVFYPGVAAAAVRVLAAEGYEVLAPAQPDCCGALELHGGAETAGARRARETIAAFHRAAGPDGLDHIVTAAAGCGSAMKGYGELLETEAARTFAASVRDVTELLAATPPRAPRGPVALRVVYHDACHLAHAQGVRSAPRELLRSIPALELLEVEGSERELCCGSAGIYNLVQPAAAATLGDRKAHGLLDTGAEAIAAGNPGCAAQLDLHLCRLGRPLPIHHPVELLDRSLAAAAGGR